MNYTHFKGYFFNWIKNQYMLLLNHLFHRVKPWCGDPEDQIPFKNLTPSKKNILWV